MTAGTVEPTAVERLSAAFAAVFENPDSAIRVFAPDAFFDLNMPVWRMQLRGAAAFAAQLRQIQEGPVRIDAHRTVASTGGFVTEHEEHQLVDGQDVTARRLWLCEVRDDLIVEAVGYCSGEWDEALRARHAVEAPMIRP